MARHTLEGGSGGRDPGSSAQDGKAQTPSLKPFATSKGLKSRSNRAASYNPEVSRRTVAENPDNVRRVAQTRQAISESKTLVVPRDICIAGAITSCDKLVVEGRVEASISDAQVIEVARTGSFKGTARVDKAEIAGQFEGELTVLDKLTVKDGGHVSGKVRYENVVIESGGEITGDMQTLSGSAQKQERQAVKPLTHPNTRLT